MALLRVLPGPAPLELERQADVEIAAQASERALRTAQQRYEAGYSAYLELLDAQRSANATRLQVVENRRAQLAATVELFKALGGGWTNRSVEPPG